MTTLKKTADGKVDKRTKEYKELVERAKQARLAKARANQTKPATKTTTNQTGTTKSSNKPAPASVKRRADGKVDLRAKEGKAIAERMAKARARKEKPQTGITGLLKKLLK